jgi:hypothetical protein
MSLERRLFKWQRKKMMADLCFAEYLQQLVPGTYASPCEIDTHGVSLYMTYLIIIQYTPVPVRIHTVHICI